MENFLLDKVIEATVILKQVAGNLSEGSTEWQLLINALGELDALIEYHGK